MELTQFITASLAPAVAMSTASILATGFQTAYSDIVTRLRALNTERRDLANKSELTFAEGERFYSLESQIALFLRLARLVQIAVVFLHAAVLCFLATSFSIAFLSEQLIWPLKHLSKGLFLTGLGCVAAGVLASLLEMRLGLRIVKYELGMPKTQLPLH